MCVSTHSAKQTINLQYKKWQKKPNLKPLLTECFMDVTYLQSTITVHLIRLLAFIFLFFFCFFFFFFFFQEKACKVVLKGAMSRHFFCVLIKTLQVPYCLYTLVIYFFEHEMKICDKFSRKDLCKVVFGPKRVRT